MDSVLIDKNARKTIKTFPKEIKLELGRLLLALQKGDTLSMPTSRPMDIVMKGASEIRMKDEAGNYRVFYYTKVLGKILVFHAFIKKTEQTANKEILTGRKRLKNMLDGGFET